MTLSAGVISWILIGLLLGLVAGWLLPGRPRMSWYWTVTVGSLGALGGGLLATALGFGGMASFDLRALATAALSALLCLLVLRLVTLPSRR